MTLPAPGDQKMSKLAMFLAGMLLGLFLALYHIRSQQIREYNLGPQPTGQSRTTTNRACC